MSHDAHFDLSAHVRKYVAVFGSLAVLTVVTVAISYLHLSPAAAVTLALAVALTKGALVAAVFMHLIDEVRIIYQVLLLTVVFFVALMALPTSWHEDLMTVKPVWTQEVPVRKTAGGHGGHGEGAAAHDAGTQAAHAEPAPAQGAAH
ncbi:MAG TPA: cytochrome C oxidase subunit IV family protein [Candidatus Limnocylindrales bacterium]|nr:cytochrome C oxidase subunit IV family protein [Candidatus Limnocylindrales bacterium]